MLNLDELNIPQFGRQADRFEAGARAPKVTRILMPTKPMPPMAPEEIETLRQQAVPRLGKCVFGHLTYEVGVGSSGTVYFSVLGDLLGSSFSREPVPLHRVQRVLAAPLATGEAFPAAMLQSAFIGRARNNADVLAAVLHNEGLLAAAARPEQYVCRGDWQDWAYLQHHQLAKKTGMTAT
jgi:hypothetical protein